jgi:hypothetical protein
MSGLIIHCGELHEWHFEVPKADSQCLLEDCFHRLDALLKDGGLTEDAFPAELNALSEAPPDGEIPLEDLIHPGWISAWCDPSVSMETMQHYWEKIGGEEAAGRAVPLIKAQYDLTQPRHRTTLRRLIRLFSIAGWTHAANKLFLHLEKTMEEYPSLKDKEKFKQIRTERIYWEAQGNPEQAERVMWQEYALESSKDPAAPLEAELGVLCRIAAFYERTSRHDGARVLYLNVLSGCIHAETVEPENILYALANYQRFLHRTDNTSEAEVLNEKIKNRLQSYSDRSPEFVACITRLLH